MKRNTPDFTSPDQPRTVVDRIRYLIMDSGMTQAKFARALGIDASNLCKHLTGRLPVTDVLINRVVVNMGVSKQWLTDGGIDPYTADRQGNTPMISQQRVASRISSVPVYDIDVTAGNEELASMFTVDRIAGYVSLPKLNSESLIVHVSGDSMQPEIDNGGFIAIRPEENFNTIFWGQIYVVVTDDFRRVKYLRRHPSDPSKVILHSANPDYDDIEIDRRDIRRLFRVEAILNCKICG